MRLCLSLGFAALALAVLPACKSEQPAAVATGEVREVAVTEKGYEPARLEVTGGKPITLRFTRKTKDTCGEAVLIQGDPVQHMLPYERSIDVTVTPPKSGELAFACGMGMMHGVLIARP